MSKKLTIGIPTWNRAREIRDALDSVVFQLDSDEKSKSEVEIFVSINASADNTEDIIKEYQNRYPDIEIRYFVQSQNVGFDRNVDNLFKNAKGEFVWILSDDDALEEGAIESVLEVIDTYESQNLGAIFVNSNAYDIKLKNKLSSGDIIFEHFKDVYAIRGIDLINKYLIYGILFVSSNIFKRGEWNKFDLSCFYQTQAIQMGGSQFIIKDSCVFIMKEPLVKHRGGELLTNENDRWNAIKDPLRGDFGFSIILQKIKNYYPKEIYDKLYYKQMLRVLKAIFILNAKKQMTFKYKFFALKQMLNLYDKFKCISYLHFIALFIPSFICKIVWNK